MKNIKSIFSDRTLNWLTMRLKYIDMVNKRLKKASHHEHDNIYDPDILHHVLTYRFTMDDL